VAGKSPDRVIMIATGATTRAAAETCNAADPSRLFPANDVTRPASEPNNPPR